MDQLTAILKRYPSQRKVARKLLEYGIRVQDGVAYCGDIVQTDAGIARACEVDRRVVRTTLEHISEVIEKDAVYINTSIEKSEHIIALSTCTEPVSTNRLIVFGYIYE